jgi:hypothetical protein
VGQFLTTPGSDLAWREVLIFALVAVLIVVVAYWQVVFAGRTLSLGATWLGVLPSGPFGYPNPIVTSQTTDPLGFYIREPWRMLAARLWTQGHLPLWDPYSGAGMPLDPFSQSDAFFAPEMVFSALPPLWWDAYALLRLVLCGVFAYLFLRTLRLSPLGAGAGAIAYMLSGALMWVVSTDMIDGFMLTPLLLWCIERLVTSRAHKLSWSVGVALLSWQLLLSGFSESAILALVLTACYYLVRAVQEAVRAAGPRLASWRDGLREGLRTLPAILLRYALIVLAAGALAAPALLLFLELVRNSGGEAPLLNTARVVGAPDLHYAFLLFFPYFDGQRLAQWTLALPGGANARSYFGYSGLVAGYLAIVAVLAALVALARRQWSARWVYTLFFAVVGALVLARIYNLPVAGFISDLPVLRAIPFFHYAGGIWAICVGVLVGVGTDMLLAPRGWLRLASIGAFLLMLGLLVVPNFLELQTALHGMSVAQQQATFAVTTSSLVAGVVVLGGLLLALVLGGYIPRVAQVGIVVLLLIELINYVPTSLPLRYDAYTPPPYLAYIQRQQTRQLGRTFGFDGVAYPNVADGLEMQDVREFNALPPADYYALIAGGYGAGAFKQGGWTGLTPGAKPTRPAQLATQHQWMLSLLNTRFVLSAGTTLGPTQVLMHAVNPPFDLTATPPLTPGGSLSETFTDPTPDLSAVLLSFTGQIASADAAGSGTVTLDLHAGGTLAATIVRTVTLPLSQVQTSGVTRFAFTPLPDSAGQPYLLVVTARGLSPTTHLALWAVTSSAGYPVSGASVGTNPMPNAALALAIESGTLRSSDYHLVYNQDVQIYENPMALPRAFAAQQVESGVDDNQALTQLAAPSFAPASTLLLADTPPAAEVAAANAAQPSARAAASTVRVTSYQVDSVTLQANMAQAGFVALQDTYYPGWHVTVDGISTPIYRSDIMFRAVFVPAGQHVIHFTYLPDSFAIGLLFVPLPPVLLLGWLALAWVIRRAHPARRGETHSAGVLGAEGGAHPH